MAGLERHGFFEGEMEGSKRYREKTALAEVTHRVGNTLCTVGSE